MPRQRLDDLRDGVDTVSPMLGVIFSPIEKTRPEKKRAFILNRLTARTLFHA